MAYQRDNNVKKSLMTWITDTINTDGTFVCGDGSTMISIMDAFPVNPTTFKIPSMSIDFDRTAPRKQYDLGVDAIYGFDVIIDMWFQNKFSGEYVSSTIKSGMYSGLIEYRDYNLNINGACIIGYMHPKSVVMQPIRDSLPGGEGDYRYQLTCLIEYNDSY